MYKQRLASTRQSAIMPIVLCYLTKTTEIC
jgi:hypothetical protein